MSEAVECKRCGKKNLPKDGVHTCTPKIYLLKEEIEQLKKDKHGLFNALASLVDLKNYKDKFGKDGEYRKRQPVVWEAARLALKHKGEE